MNRRILSLVVLLSGVSIAGIPHANAQIKPPSKRLEEMANQRRAAKAAKAANSAIPARSAKLAGPAEAGSLKPYPGSLPFIRHAPAVSATRNDRKVSFYTADPALKILAHYKAIHEKAGYKLASNESFKTRTGADATSLGFTSKGRTVVVQVYHGKVKYSEYAENAGTIPAGSSLILIDVSGN